MPEQFEEGRNDTNRHCEACGVTAVVTPTASNVKLNFTVTTTPCISNQTYNVRLGDTCDSIAVAHNVSSATLFTINQNLYNCAAPAIGISLCLPLACQNIYTVQPTDNCTEIAVNNGVPLLSLVAWNPTLDLNCTHLFNAVQPWGTTLCVSTPGGPWVGNATNGTSAGSWETGTGFSDIIVSPPPGATVATGTTLNCGVFTLETGNLTCVEMCMANLITSDLFLAVNPSLKNTTCDSDLVVGSVSFPIHSGTLVEKETFADFEITQYYCTQPYYDWVGYDSSA